MDFAKVIDEVAGFLEREQAPFALAGALALQAYGMTRATADVDFVTDSAVAARLVEFLESLGYETLYASVGYSNHVHHVPALGRVDVVYIEGETSKELFGAAETTVRIGGRELRVPRPEHLAAMKVHAMKNDPSRALQESADIGFLLKLPGIDREEIRGYFEKAGLRAKFEEIIRSLPDA